MALAFENPQENDREKLLQHIKEMIKENPLD
jgi:hypothetical protein